MTSLIEGYNYDIFISYRQKDNKHDGWVTTFVENLKGELESTFKEDISVYFDENPHDRLQDTHNVNKSLEGKLKCVVFIPILSQTYCDPASYAWQFEFMPFLRMTEDDRFGRDVKLKNGNVASRILPVRIHDLDPEDVRLFEKETGNVLRAIDFIFRTAGGVNRPLVANEDHPNDNLNKTYYRDQINKVAIAIKEIIGGLKAESVPNGKNNESSRGLIDNHAVEEETLNEKSARPDRQKMLAAIFISVLILCTFLYFVFPGIFRGGKSKVARDPGGKISLAINDFANNTNDTTINWLRQGIPELIRVNLGNSEELSIQNSRTMADVYENVGRTRNLSMTPALSNEAARKLRARAYITGSFQKYDNKLITLVKLTDTQSDELLWTGKSEADLQAPDGILMLGEALSSDIKNFLEIKVLKEKTKNEYSNFVTSSSEAFRKYIEGMNSMLKNDYNSALVSFMDSYELDSTSALTTFYVAIAYDGLAVFEDAKYRSKAALWTQKAYDLKENLSGDTRLWLEMWQAYYNTRNSDNVLKYLGLLENTESKDRNFLYDIGQTFGILKKYDKELKMFRKIDQVNAEWGEVWKNLSFYYQYSSVLNELNMHEEAAKKIDKGLELFPDDFGLKWLRARCAISQGDNDKADLYIAERIKEMKEAGSSPAYIERVVGYLYEQGNSLGKAEEKYRNAKRLDPNDDWANFRLAYLLITRDLNVEEGIGLLDALEKKNPGMWNNDFFTVKSEALYKLGKFSVADSLLHIVRDSSYTANIELDQLMKKVDDSLKRRN
jgi:tetratricopeptide (TPR) repeat protein